MKVISELEEAEIPSTLHPRRRMVVLARGDGHFTFAEQYHYTTEWEGKVIAEGWATLPCEGIFATAADAEAEARAAIARWE